MMLKRRRATSSIARSAARRRRRPRQADGGPHPPSTFTHLEHDRHRGIARGTALEQPIAAAAIDQLLDELDDRTQAGRTLGMAPDERAAMVVHAHEIGAGLAREDDVVH